MSTTVDRPLRADARRNREKVLDAARGAFAETGLHAQIEDIARRAGVGVGTVYRHFPTKDALVAALAEAHFAHLADIVEAGARREGDAWEVFAATILDSAAPTAGDAALCEIIAGHPQAIEAAALGQERLKAATGALMGAAQRAGQMRDDATVQDVQAIMCGFGQVAAAQRAGAQMDWQRYLTIALDGLRAR
ncbi:MAG: TetR/AcrR family transcriptional regulator [Solirubrobacterales bacterium]|nr:TetR/AcrR family transcriptional regulator [Solirubrobacterales bacterium]